MTPAHCLVARRPVVRGDLEASLNAPAEHLKSAGLRRVQTREREIGNE